MDIEKLTEKMNSMLDTVAGIIEAELPKGRHVGTHHFNRGSDYVSVRLEPCFGVCVSLTIRMDVDRDFKKIHPKIDISWPSTGHSVSSARASIALFQKVADVAALCETVLNPHRSVVW